MSAINVNIAGSAAGGVRATPRLLMVLTGVTLLSIGVGIYLGLSYAPQDPIQGDIQRIFYFHMPAFVGAFMSFFAAVVGGIGYLRTRNPKWDTLSVAGVEIGLVLATMNMITGMIWGKPIWNTFWTWDPRLTLEAVMMLTYGAYLVLRGAIGNVEQRRRFAAVYGIFAIITAILVFIISRIRPDTIHPTVLGPSSTQAQGGFKMTATMSAALGVNMLIWGIFVPITLLWYRIRLSNAQDKVNEVKASIQ